MPDLNDQKLQAEIDKIKAEITKLETETATLKRPVYLQPAAWVPLLVALVGLGTSLIQLNKKSNELDKTTTKLETAKRNFRADANWLEGITKQEAIQDKMNEIEVDLQKSFQEKLIQLAETRQPINKTTISQLSQHAAQILKITPEVQQQFTNTFEATLAQAQKTKLDVATAKTLSVQLAKTATNAVSQYADIPRKVVIHYRETQSRDLSEKLQQLFNSKGIPSPPPQHIDRDFGSSIRYSYKSDRPIADSVMKTVQDFLHKHNCSAVIPISLHTESQSVQKPGAIEVWYNPVCN